MHEVLGNRLFPFAYLIVRLEWMAPEHYQSNGKRRTDLRNRFRCYTTKRELY